MGSAERHLRPVGPLSAALAETLASLDPPASDAGLVATLVVLAEALDGMSPDERRRMLGQTMPQLHRGLAELERRREKRAAVKAPPGRLPPSRMEDFRSRFRTWETEREAFEARNARRAAKLKGQGLTVEQIGAAMKTDTIIVRQWLEMASETPETEGTVMVPGSVTVIHSPGGRA